jgi:hypothetical protein
MRSPRAGFGPVATVLAINRAAYLTIRAVFPDSEGRLRTSGAARAGTKEAATVAADAPNARFAPAPDGNTTAGNTTTPSAGRAASVSLGSRSGFFTAVGVGIAWGNKVAAAIINDRKNDGSMQCVFEKMFTGVPPPREKCQDHLPDPTFPKFNNDAAQKMYAPFWGEVQPFGFTNKFSDDTITPLPPPLSLNYAEDYDFVRLKGRRGPPPDPSCDAETGPPTTRTPEEEITVRLASSDHACGSAYRPSTCDRAVPPSAAGQCYLIFGLLRKRRSSRSIETV